jgi:hypothetical protein
MKTKCSIYHTSSSETEVVVEDKGVSTKEKVGEINISSNQH